MSERYYRHVWDSPSASSPSQALTRQLSQRAVSYTHLDVYKRQGKSLAGLTLSASMLSLFGCSQKQVDSGAVATWALPQGLLVVNADLCTGCQRCEINCTLTNDGVCSSYTVSYTHLDVYKRQSPSSAAAPST